MSTTGFQYFSTPKEFLMVLVNAMALRAAMSGRIAPVILFWVVRVVGSANASQHPANFTASSAVIGRNPSSTSIMSMFSTTESSATAITSTW